MRRGLVLVTGAGGFVGSHIVEVLIESGYEVRGVDLPGTSSEAAVNAGAKWMEVDLTEPREAARAVRGVRGVVHAAGMFDLGMPWDSLYQTNVLTTEALCEAAVEEGIDKFVHISSIGIYGVPEQIPASEEAPQEPSNDFEKTKLLAEEKVWHYQRFRGLPATALRPALIYGPRGRYAMATVLALFALGRDRQYPWLRKLGGGALGHHVHVRDVARASQLLLRSADTIGRGFNVGDSTPLRWGELLQYVAELTEFEGDSVPLVGPLGRLAAVAGQWFPSHQLIDLNRTLSEDWDALTESHKLRSPLVPRLDRDMFSHIGEDRVYDTSALRQLGFKPDHPVTLNGLRDAFDWYMSEGWLPGQKDLAQN